MNDQGKRGEAARAGHTSAAEGGRVRRLSGREGEEEMSPCLSRPPFPKSSTRALEKLAVDGAAEHLHAPAPIVVAKGPPSPAEAYLASLSEGSSRETMTSALVKVSKILNVPMGVSWVPIFVFPWHKVTYALAAGFRSHVAASCALASANLYVAALRGVVKVCASLGLTTYEQRERVLEALKRIRGRKEPSGRALGDGEVRKMFGACDTRTAIGKRDAALLTLLYGCGLRRAEASGVGLETLHRDGARASIVVDGKGNKQRKLSLSQGALAILEDWLHHRGDDPGPILLTCDEGRKPRPFSPDGIYSRLVQLAKSAGLEHVSPHDLRRTFITNLFDDGVDANTASKLAGHENLQTTMGYDRRGEKARADVMDTFHGDRFKDLRRT